MSALSTMLQGVPNFFSPRPMPPINTTAKRPEEVGYYDAAPLKATLERLVDFDLINRKTIQFSMGAANVRTGAPVTFDNLDEKMTIEHVMASASLPPGFAPTKVDGEYYWDGAVVSNTPMQCVIDSSPSRSELVFQVDLWDSSGEVPLDISSAYLRATEMHSASRLNVSLDQYRKMQRFKHAVCRFLDKLPTDYRNDPEFKALARQAYVKVATIVQLKYQTKKYETTGKTFEFSRRGMKEHWHAGYEDALAALNEPSVHELPPASEAARIYDVHRGWLK
jgi:NTE family protein